MKSVFAKITFIDEDGRPVDPGFGGGRPGGVDPDYGFDSGGHPSTGPIWGGRPDHSLPIAGHPDNSLPWAPVSKWPPDPTDPEYGAGVPMPPRATHPIFLPVGPGHPDNALPPYASHKPPTNPPPGTIWPPLPGNPPAGPTALLVWLVGVGWRYMVVDIPPTTAAPK